MFDAKFKLCLKLLKIIGLDEESNKFPKPESNPASFYKHHSYIELWKDHYKKRIFHFCLSDLSLFFFNDETGSFIYFECPLNILTYNIFLKKYLDTSFDSVGNEYRSEYEQYVSEADEKKGYVYLRYDYSESEYKHARHPAAHLHVGYKTQIRLSSKFKLDPLFFFSFVIRQCYPDQWSRLLGHEKFTKQYKSYKYVNLAKVDRKYFCNLDLSELHLS